MKKSIRYMYLDAARAIMMLLGIVIHTSQRLRWESQSDHSSTMILNILGDMIHSFRMPAFFIVAGFFFSLMCAKRGYFNVIKERFNRLIIPTISTLAIIVVPISGWLGLPNSFYHVGHLWFLICLYVYVIFSIIVLYALSENDAASIGNSLRKNFDRSLTSSLLILVFLSYLSYRFSLSGDILTFTIIENLSISKMIALYPFFVFGGIAFLCKNKITKFFHFSWTLTVVAFVLSIIPIEDPYMNILSLKTEFYHVFVHVRRWITSYVVISIFVHFLNRDNGFIRYISDASYTVYLFHVSIIEIVIYFIGDNSIWFISFFLVIALTTSCSFGIYHFLVRPSKLLSFLFGGPNRRAVPSVQRAL